MRRISIPAAFIICGLSCMLAALVLTKVTVWFARKNIGDIAQNYEHQPVLWSGDYGVEYLPREEFQWGFINLEQGQGVFVDSGGQDAAELQQAEELLDGLQQAEELSDEPQQVEELLDEPQQAEELPVKGQEAGKLLTEVFVINLDMLQEADRTKYDFFTGLDDIAAIFWYSIFLCLAALIFYLWKLKKPFRILNQAVQKILDNDLDYQIEYDGQDEFGRLCHAFERMRQELVHNNQKMWDSVEERKRLNAAFAHDLRTPITILQGYTDLMLGDLAEGAAAEREFAGSIRAISRQIGRLNAYVDTMGTLQRLEDYEPCSRRVLSSSVTELVSETAALLFPKGKVEIQSDWKEQEFMLDQEAFSQICENILSNASRYARERIVVSLCQEQDALLFSVVDDGTGFSRKDLENASLAYYRGGKWEADAVSHFGLGLYICQVLVKKMGGELGLSNVAGGGAKVTVKICCRQ